MILFLNGNDADYGSVWYAFIRFKLRDLLYSFRYLVFMMKLGPHNTFHKDEISSTSECVTNRHK